MPGEAPLERRMGALQPAGPGWFVLNARDALWLDSRFGAFTRFESGAAEFEHLGLNLTVLQPGQPSCFYHREDTQEDFLVLAGECLVLIEEQERRLRQWDLVHCPPHTNHVFVGAGDGPCTLLAVGNRPDTEIVYPRSELALRHGAGVERETPDPDEAYGERRYDVTPFNPDWLPG